MALQETEAPAPVDGMNTVAPGRRLAPTECIYAYNLVGGDLGMVTRTGWREYVTGLTGTADDAVRTVLSFHASTPSANKLFATTSTGIWDVTASTTSPTLVLAFVSNLGNAGWGVAQAVVTAGGHFLLYADEVNGLHYYSESTGAWAAYTAGAGTGQINGVNPASIVSVTVWKTRVWLTERGTAAAWYLDVGAVFGTATKFNFGQRFAHGGYLVGLFNWSTDGGSGLDTALVAIGAGGDVVIYVGTDPSSASTFGLKGVWFVGAIPGGRRIATDLGGDLLIISSLGILPLSKLLIGNPVVDRTQYETKKIANLFTRLVRAGRDFLGWSLHTHPTDNALLVFVPSSALGNTNQLAMSTTTRAWTRYRDLPMLSAAVWDGALYFGTADGRICINEGDVDHVLLSDGGDSAAPIEWSLLTPYRGDARNKQVQMVRPVLLSEETQPVVEATVLYDWNLEEPAEPTGESVGGPGSWDYGFIEGVLDFDCPTGTRDVEVSFPETDPPSADPSNLFFRGINPEVSPYDSYEATGPAVGVFHLTDPVNLDHFTDEVVRVQPVDDTGTWDVALWGGGDLPSVGLTGATGMGKDFAIAIRGSARGETTLIGIDVLFTLGGYL